jgi:hypothetical protein
MISSSNGESPREIVFVERQSPAVRMGLRTISAFLVGAALLAPSWTARGLILAMCAIVIPFALTIAGDRRLRVRDRVVTLELGIRIPVRIWERKLDKSARYVIDAENRWILSTEAGESMFWVSKRRTDLESGDLMGAPTVGSASQGSTEISQLHI